MMEPFKTSIRMGMITMPQGSRWMCGMGFNVTWPPSEAVSSAPILAARACAASWQVVEKRKTTYQMNPRASCSGEMLGMKGDFVSPVGSVDGPPQVCKGSEKRLKVRRFESLQVPTEAESLHWRATPESCREGSAFHFFCPRLPSDATPSFRLPRR